MTRVALVTVAAAVLTLATVVWPWSSSWSSGRWEGGGRRAWPRVVRPAHEDAGEEGSPPWTPARWRPGSARRSSRRWSPPQFGRARRARRDAERRSVAVLDLLDALAPALRAGLPPPAALRAIAHPSPERRSALLVALLEAADRAEDLAPVWRAEAEELASSDLGLVAAAWALCEGLGSPLAPTVATVSRAVRQRRALRQRMEAALAGPRTSMTVLTALPAAGPVLALTMGVSPLDLYASPAGAGALASGVVLVGVGRLWGARLVASVGVDGPAHRGRRRAQGRQG